MFKIMLTHDVSQPLFAHWTAASLFLDSLSTGLPQRHAMSSAMSLVWHIWPHLVGCASIMNDVWFTETSSCGCRTLAGVRSASILAKCMDIPFLHASELPIVTSLVCSGQGVLRYSRNVHLMWVRFLSNDTKESGSVVWVQESQVQEEDMNSWVEVWVLSLKRT
jgi:hypothetical protein